MKFLAGSNAKIALTSLLPMGSIVAHVSAVAHRQPSDFDASCDLSDIAKRPQTAARSARSVHWPWVS